MTIGPTSRHSGPVHTSPGGTQVGSVSARDGVDAGRDRFAQALRTAVGGDPRGQRFGGTAARKTAERFNENGFFADAGAMAAPAMATPDDDTDVPTGEGRTLDGATTVLATAPHPAQAVVASAPITAGAGAAGPLRTALATAAATIALPCPATITEPVTAFSAPLSTRASAGTIELEMPAMAARPVKPSLPPTAGGKSLVSVALDAGDGAAAVTISANGLNDQDIDALRADIAALLRRHGLRLGDVKLNGRPTGQGKHDRSGD